jgi:hypothetical protein
MARILDVTPYQYHQDPCDPISLSASMAHTLVAESPEKAEWKHPKLKNGDPFTTSENDGGSLCHALMLGADNRVVIVEHENFKTKVAQQLRDEALEKHLLPVTRPFYDRHVKVVEILREKFAKLGYEFTGRSEVAIEWNDDGVLCRSMLDHVFLDRGVWWDLKTTSDARKHKVEKHFVDFSYDIQHEAYCRAMADLEPSLVGRVEGTFLFCELDPPYAVNVVQPTGIMKELGRIRWEMGRRRWKECLESGRWGGYSDGIMRVDPPNYAIKQYFGEDA